MTSWHLNHFTTHHATMNGSIIKLPIRNIPVKSEIVNDLIRKARKQQPQLNWIQAKIERAENSGFIHDNKAQILNQARSSQNN